MEVLGTYGAMLAGGFVAAMLSGIVTIQALIYFRLYMQDSWWRKTMVLAVWVLDILHSTFIFISLFDYLITYFGALDRTDHIPWSIALTIVVTAIQTLIAHCHFSEKIHRSSDKNWAITIPILFLAFLRLGAASVSTYEMIRLHRFSVFTESYPGWIFTTGLSLSSAVDLLITAWLCYFLHLLRRRIDVQSSILQVIDSLTLYTLENGLLTSVVTTASLICWLVMPTNLVFLGLHFVIEKLYANSVLASLNTRKELRELRQKMRAWGDLPVLSSEDFYTQYQPRHAEVAYRPRGKIRQLEVTVKKTVERVVHDEESMLSPQREYYSPYSRLTRKPTVLEWRNSRGAERWHL
ncbi:uncharacterized protein EV420DRAFT_1721982 [Desarmillaria tabescens]|uniref:DUF6534 domain-containing protein n=1 Tax=Armillaria tabescens TaxID=1929756 RepID=A0AA39MS63_ARMTA|nr:uncharacterized protein EV420DRAFT_1721982 [Desarmillaria tabescens]KAK0444632.1 hypothetical protein EV420DRAFT_1721982 [Desarmillaria tabescens]